MKTLTTIFLLVALTGTVASARALEISTAFGGHKKEKTLFVVKANKKLIGAKVEVFGSSGERIAVQTLDRKKLIIDFANTNQGEYMIRVSKGDKKQEFQFMNK